MRRHALIHVELEVCSSNVALCNGVGVAVHAGACDPAAEQVHACSLVPELPRNTRIVFLPI